MLRKMLPEKGPGAYLAETKGCLQPQQEESMEDEGEPGVELEESQEEATEGPTEEQLAPRSWEPIVKYRK